MKSSLVLTVCLGNIHRSVVAEYALRQALQMAGLAEEILVTSRGILGMPGLPAPSRKNIQDYPDKWPYVESTLNRLGLNVSTHQTRPLDHDIVSRSSLILAMDRKILIDHPCSIVRVFPAYAWKARLFSEIDGTASDIDDCDEVQEGDFHRRVTEHIHELVHRRVHHIVELARLLNAGR